MLGNDNKKLKIFLSSMAICGMCFSSVGSPGIFSFSVEEKRKNQSELRRKNKELIRDKDKAEKDKNQEFERKNALDEQIKEVEGKIENSTNYINELENQVSEIKQNICEIENDVENESNNLEEALVLIEKTNDITALEMVLNSKDTNDFIEKVSAVQTVSKTVKETIDILNEKSAQLANEQAKVEEIKKVQEEEKINLENNQAELKRLIEESEKLISKYSDMVREIKNKIEDNEAAIESVDKEIERYYEQQRRKEEEQRRKEEQQRRQHAKPSSSTPSFSGTVNQGKYLWPVPGFSRISSGYFDCEGRSRMHGAIDIASTNGRSIFNANVVASEAGKVIKVLYSSKGYGNNVVIDHGKGFSTQYSHLDSISVSEGQTVSRGQVIGKVGNTGYSTGAHLDFTFRVNGEKQNPLNYVHP